MRGIFAVLLAIPLVGCGSKYDRQVDLIEWFFGLGETGTSPDYMLVKSGLWGPDRVAVIFGFADDGSFCNEIAQMYMQRYPSDSYYCSPVN